MAWRIHRESKRAVTPLAVVLGWGLVLLCAAACGEKSDDTGGGTDGAGEGGVSEADWVAVTGLSTPESALHDTAADVYLVSNINGGPSDEDGNGFISRVSPEGELLEAHFIDGASDDITLNGPKGLGIFQDELYVADITAVRVFNRLTGEAVDSVDIAGASFLNDVAVDDAGNVFVSHPPTDTVYQIRPDRSFSAFAVGDGWTGPNGVAVLGDDIRVTASESKVVHLNTDGSVAGEIPTPADRLDGLIIREDGTLLVSSWAGEAVYQSDQGGDFYPIVENLPSAADIGLDAERNRLLVPRFNEDELTIIPLP